MNFKYVTSCRAFEGSILTFGYVIYKKNKVVLDLMNCIFELVS